MSRDALNYSPILSFLYVLHKSQGIAKETLKCHPKNLLLSINPDLRKTELHEELSTFLEKSFL